MVCKPPSHIRRAPYDVNPIDVGTLFLDVLAPEREASARDGLLI